MFKRVIRTDFLISFNLALLLSLSFVYIPPAAAEGHSSDIMLGYTNIVRSAHGSDRNTQAIWRSAINYFNKAVVPNSKIEANVRVIGFVRVSMREGDSAQILDDLRWGTNLSSFRSMADWYGADLLQIAARTEPGNGGRATVGGRHSVIQYNRLLWTIVAHELGHNFGAVHARGSYMKDGNVTLMHVNTDARIPMFSSPYRYWNGYPSGSAYRNNAQTVNFQAPYKSKIRVRY